MRAILHKGDFMSVSIISNTRRMPDTENGLHGTAAVRSSTEDQETDDIFRSLRASLMSRLDEPSNEAGSDHCR